MTDHPDANFGPALRPIRFDHALGEAETKRLYELQIQLDDRIDAWHSSNSSLELHEFLDMTSTDYNLFVTDPSTYFKNRLESEILK